MADTVGWDLQHVFKQGDAPGNERSDPPGLVVEVLEMGVPGVIGDD